MKKSLCFLLSGILLCSTIVLSGFADKNSANSSDVTQEQIEENIIGRWMIAELDGQPVPTNEKAVFNFVPGNKVYVSASFNSRPDVHTQWLDLTEDEVIIDGNKLTITRQSGEQSSPVTELIITSISDNEFTADLSLILSADGAAKSTNIGVYRYVKINDDYSDGIIGTWEGRCTSEGSIFDDGQDHRWEYKTDGTYVYYVKDGNNWVPSDNELNEYFVAGSLLCTRWIEDDVESREWWEITIDGDKMNWTALREDENGKTFTATFEMNKVTE